ncbi:Hypothetical protein CCH01_019020 [Clostridium chauvoei JF4335]|nr:Hypothetical protein CCH01_019020 [Clostridium chauvoei JF4335]
MGFSILKVINKGKIAIISKKYMKLIKVTNEFSTN